jgi:hypothetical protein
MMTGSGFFVFTVLATPSMPAVCKNDLLFIGVGLSEIYLKIIYLLIV